MGQGTHLTWAKLLKAEYNSTDWKKDKSKLTFKRLLLQDINLYHTQFKQPLYSLAEFNTRHLNKNMDPCEKLYTSFKPLTLNYEIKSILMKTEINPERLLLF
jgi:hypothetical protein